MRLEAIMRRWGQKITVNGKEGSGFLLPMHPKNAEINKRPLPVGVVNGETYLLITAMPLSENDKVLCEGLCYEVRRSTKQGFGAELSHYEGVLRLAGRVGDA